MQTLILCFGLLRLTVQDAIDLALKGSPEVLVQKFITEQAREEWELSRRRLFSPTLSFQWQASPEQKGVFFIAGVPFSTSASLYSTQLSLSKLWSNAWQLRWDVGESRFQQSFPTPSTLYFSQSSLTFSYPLWKLQREKLLSPIDLANLSQVEQGVRQIQSFSQVAFQVQQTFWDTLRWKETVQVQKRLLAEIELTRNSVEEKIRTGKLPPSEILVAEADVQQRNLQVSLALESYENSLALLKFLLALPPEEEIELIPQEIPYQKFQREELEQSPAIRLKKLSLQRLQVQRNNALAENKGEFSLALGVIFQGRGTDHPEAMEDFRLTEWNFRFQYVQTPGLKSTEPMEKAIEAAEQSLVEERNRLTNEWATAVRNLEASQERVIVAEKNVQVARNALQAARARFDVGLASILDLTHSQNQLLTVELALLEARYQVHINQARLALLLGKF